MKSIIGLLVFSMNCLAVSYAQKPNVPAELRSFIPKGYEALDLEKQDMDGDNRADFLLVLKVLGEDTMTYENENWEAERPILLILRQPDGSLKQAARNDHLIYCKQCGGMMGDPYQGIATKPGEFSADFYGGSSWRWESSYTFRYDHGKKDWFLEKEISASYQSGDPAKTMDQSTITRSEIGDVSLRDFIPYYNTDSSSWKVSVAKTFFYRSPSIGSNPKKAWLVKGNIVTSSKQFKNFIECSFTNSKGNTTHGFILKKDLVLLKSNTPQATR